MKKKVLFSAVALMAASATFAQGNGMAGITEATNMVTSYFDPATKLIYAIGAVVGLIGGVKVYGKFSSGDPVVRCVYLFDCRCHYPTFILPLKERTMADYPINRGIGKPVEFRGLKSQYLFIFAGGLLALFVLFIIMYMVGINQWVCIIFGVTSATLLVWLTFRLNEKYGTHGLMKLSARKNHPFHIINRKAISQLFTKNQKQVSK